MTKEELKQEAKEFATKRYKWTENNFALEVSRKSYFAGTEPREKQIEIDAEQIRALQKQNGELTDKVNDLEEKLANADYQLEGRDNEIRELKAENEANENGAKKYAEFYFETNDQLTKAKELLKEWLQTSKASGCDNINIVTDTEQFLKD